MKLTYVVVMCIIGFIAFFFYKPFLMVSNLENASTFYKPLLMVSSLENASTLDINCFQEGENEELTVLYTSVNFPFEKKKVQVEQCGKMFAKIVKSSTINAHNAMIMRLVYTEEDIYIFFYGAHVDSSLPPDFSLIGKELMKVVDGLNENSISRPWVERNENKWVMHAKRIPPNTLVSTQ